MKKIAFLLLSTFCLLSISIQGISQQRDLEKFTKLDVSGSYEITLVKSDTHYAVIDMVRGDIEDCIIEVSGSTLKLKYKQGLWKGNKNKARVSVHYVDLDAIDLSAGSTLKTDGPVNTKSMDLDVSSGASMKMELEANVLSVDLSSGSRAQVWGVADTHKVDISSGASYNSDRLECNKVLVDASSGSVASVWAKKEIIAEATSGASIKYKGNPEKTNIDVGRYSGGNIKAIK